MPKSAVITNTQHIYDLVEVCVQKGVRYAVVSPGSRCAPLLIGFGRHPKIEVISVTDERSAAFIGLGIAQQTTSPVVLVCTSGTAGQNFAPAVTEAFYQHVPLFVLTADRPPEWIDQWDGQTIHQQGLYADHIKAGMDFVAGKQSLLTLESVLDQAIMPASAPVHINIPISKPFYPLLESDIPPFRVINKAIKTSKLEKTELSINDKQWLALESVVKTSNKILIMRGQSQPDAELNHVLKQLKIPLMGDIISNGHAERTDIFFHSDNAGLCPDLLITIGRSVISEKLKQYFRHHKPTAHWHIGLGMVGDPFQSLTQTLAIEPLSFFKMWLLKGWQLKPQKSYQQRLSARSKLTYKHVQSCLSASGFNQYSATAAIMQLLPENSVLHLSNSMSVRIANHIGLKETEIKTEVWSNRGTSGIDGCVSSAVGHAIAQPEKIHTLIIGDLAFLYDRNGLWLNHPFPDNLKIVVMNNSGGGIFNLIPGPSNQGNLVELFTTPHQRTAQLTAQEFGLPYQSAKTHDELQTERVTFMQGGSKILEVFSDMQANELAFKLFNKRI